MYIFVGIVIGAFVGYVVGKKWRAGESPVDLSDPEEAHDFSDKGHKAISERIEKRKERILKKAKEEGSINNDGVEDLFCIGNTTASRYLSQLVEEGKLERHGSGRGTYYTLVQ